MRFLGIDFGWQSKPSGVAALDWNGRRLRFASMARPSTPREVLEWVDREAGDAPAMVAVDAPLVIRNAAGMREADKDMHRRYGRYHAGAYPANLGRPYAARVTEFSRALEDRGFRHAARIEARAPGRYQIEVHPHAATVCLFDLPRILKYKKGTLASRRAELRRYRRLLLGVLAEARPRLDGLALPMPPETGALLKALEDQMDAVLCAYIGAHWWHWGDARNHVMGDAASGYIVVPTHAG